MGVNYFVNTHLSVSTYVALLTIDVLNMLDEHHNFILMDLVKQPNGGQRQLTQL